MLHDNVLAESISTFGLPGHVSPSDQLITLTIGQLQDLVKDAVAAAIQPLQDRIDSLESTQDLQADNSLIQLKLINDLRQATKKEPQPMQKDRGDILRALLAASGGKLLAQDARKKMHLSKQLFSMLVASMGDYIETKPLHSDNRKLVLLLK
jgi:hypothetical protein